MPNGGGEHVKVSLVGGSVPLKASLIRLVPSGGGTCGASHACRDRCVGVGETEFTAGGVKEVEGIEGDVAPWCEGITPNESG